MADSQPHKSLWELMGQKKPEPPPTASPEPSTAVPSTDPADRSEDDSAALPPPSPQSKSKGLWALMQHSDQDAAPSGPEATEQGQTSSEAPVKRIDKRLRQMAEADLEVEVTDDVSERNPAKRVDKRLQQVEQPEVEIVDDDDVPASHKRIDKRLRQTEGLEVEIVDETPEDSETDDAPFDQGVTNQPTRSRWGIRGIPSPLAVVSTGAVSGEDVADLPIEVRPRFSLVGAGKSKSALWSVILGGLSLPLSLFAIYPAIWSRIPASVLGFGALILGFLAQGEITRSKSHGREILLAYIGMATGLLAMFSGPLIYSPLDVYGQWANSYTMDHLKQIGLATAAYSEQQHSFPAGGIFREIPEHQDLEPVHGWMTLLLPYLPEGAGLARQIDLNKPYFDPVNLPVMSQSIPTFLAAGGHTTLVQGKYGPAHFAGVGGLISLPDGSVAHAGIFDVNSETTRDEVLDGLSNTMIAGEIWSAYPAWGEPRNWRQIGKGLNRDPEGFGNARHTGAMFLMADGSVRFLPNQTDPKVLQALSTRDAEDLP